MKKLTNLKEEEERLDTAINSINENIGNLQRVEEKKRKLNELLRKRKLLIKKKNPLFRLGQELKEKISNYNKNYYDQMGGQDNETRS